MSREWIKSRRYQVTLPTTIQVEAEDDIPNWRLRLSIWSRLIKFSVASIERTLDRRKADIVRDHATYK